MVSYSTSKAAVIGLTKSLGKEYAQTNITINSFSLSVFVCVFLYWVRPLVMLLTLGTFDSVRPSGASSDPHVGP